MGGAKATAEQLDAPFLGETRLILRFVRRQTLGAPS